MLFHADMVFWALNNGANASNLTSADVSKKHELEYSPPITFVFESKTPTNAYPKRSGTKITVHNFSALILVFSKT